MPPGVADSKVPSSSGSSPSAVPTKLSCVAGSDEQEDDVAGRGVAVGGQGQRVDRGVGHLLDRGALDRRDRLLLGAAVAVAEVREGRRDGVEDRDDLEGDEEERAGQQVLHRHGAGGEVDVERQCGHGHDDGQAPPVVGADQRKGRPDGDRRHDREAEDLDHQHRGAAGAVGAQPPPGRLAARGRSGAACHVTLLTCSCGLDRLPGRAVGPPRKTKGTTPSWPPGWPWPRS